jgi:hypothetical protein
MTFSIYIVHDAKIQKNFISCAIKKFFLKKNAAKERNPCGGQSLLPYSLCNQINECYLGQKNQREAILELLMLSLMPPDIHAEQCADTATDGCQYQQECFRYAPTALLGFPFINAIDEEGHDVDDY